MILKEAAPLSSQMHSRP